MVTKYYHHACIVRSIQVNVLEYMHGVGINVLESHVMGVDPFEFHTLLQELRRGTFQFCGNWVPLREEYLLEPIRGALASGLGAVGAPSQCCPREWSQLCVIRTYWRLVIDHRCIPRLRHPS